MDGLEIFMLVCVAVICVCMVMGFLEVDRAYKKSVRLHEDVRQMRLGIAENKA